MNIPLINCTVLPRLSQLAPWALHCTVNRTTDTLEANIRAAFPSLLQRYVISAAGMETLDVEDASQNADDDALFC